MSAFAKAPPSESSDLRLILIDGNYLDAGAIEQQIKFAPAGFAFSALDHN